MKRRIPDTLEHAITVLRAELGAEECSRITGKSDSLLLKASDPDEDYMISVSLALALDRAYLNKTGEMPPIMRLFARELDLQQMNAEPPQGDVIQCALILQKSLGAYCERVQEFTGEQSAAGKALTHNEGTVIMQALDDIESVAARMKTCIRGQLRRSNPKLVKEG